ncbi:MAG: TolC family protein [Deltaproteobacteria bacterium]|nr:MAG: TolC family protein [Deltaproteobacteria bacterium]
MSWSRWLLALVLSTIVATRAASEPPAAPPEPAWRGAVLPEQWRPGVAESAAVRVPTPITRDEAVERVTLKEAIGLALQNNPGIAAQRLEPTRQAEGILQAQAQYDPSLSGELDYSRAVTPNASVLGGTLTSVVEDRYANLHLFKLLRSGTQIMIDSLNDRFDSNSRFIQLRPQYKPQLNFSLVQPLLQSFGWDFSYLVVRVAERTADAAVYQYEANLANFLEQVIDAYWAVVGARENVEVDREAKQLADRTVDENQARVRVGLLPPVSVLEAQADAASRQSDLIAAENRLAVARQTLAQLVYYRPADTFVPRTLEPSETAEPEEVSVDLDETLAVALAARPEIQASARGVTVQQLNEKIAGNALLPVLNMVGSYGVNGLSGTNRAAVFGSTTTFSLTPIAGARCVSLAPNQGFLCTVPGLTPPSPFAGSASEAYDRMASNDFSAYSFGLRFQVPLSNALARSQYTASRIARSEAELNHRQLLSNVTLEVRQAVADLVSSRQRIDTTRVARELAEENLRNQQKRHEVGMATTKDLLDFQTRLTTARGAEVQAKIDYAIAVARWRRARGQLLAYYQVVVEHPGRHSAPWFARF